MTTLNDLNLSCHYVRSLKEIGCVRVQSNYSEASLNQEIVFIPYDHDFNKKGDAVMKLKYSNQLCEIMEINIKGIIIIIILNRNLSSLCNEV